MDQDCAVSPLNIQVAVGGRSGCGLYLYVLYVQFEGTAHIHGKDLHNELRGEMG